MVCVHHRACKPSSRSRLAMRLTNATHRVSSPRSHAAHRRKWPSFAKLGVPVAFPYRPTRAHALVAGGDASRHGGQIESHARPNLQARDPPPRARRSPKFGAEAGQPTYPQRYGAPRNCGSTAYPIADGNPRQLTSEAPAAPYRLALPKLGLRDRGRIEQLDAGRHDVDPKAAPRLLAAGTASLRRSGTSSTSFSRASANRDGSPKGTTSPERPSLTSSGTPRTRVATTGRAAAIASITVSGHAS